MSPVVTTEATTLEQYERMIARAERLIETLFEGTNLMERYHMGEEIGRFDLLEQVLDEARALDEQTDGSFTIQLDVDSANAARKKDGTVLKVTLTGEWTEEVKQMVPRLIDLSMVGGTQVTFKPVTAPTAQWVQPRLQPTPMAADYDERADEDEPPEEQDQPSKPGRARRGAQPVAPGDGRGI